MSEAQQPSGSAGGTAKNAGVSMTALIWIGVAVVLLSFVASFLGARLAQPAAEPEPTPTASETPSTEDYEAALEEILPAGASVRAGSGAPESGKGYEGNAYIDLSTSDVFVFRDGDWVYAGNIRESAAENLTGEAGPAGESGAAGAPGPTGAAGAPGTQLILGVGAPTSENVCETDGDVFVDTSTLEFYECTAGEWMLFGPTPSTLPAP